MSQKIPLFGSSIGTRPAAATSHNSEILCASTSSCSLSISVLGRMVSVSPLQNRTDMVDHRLKCRPLAGSERGRLTSWHQFEFLPHILLALQKHQPARL